MDRASPSVGLSLFDCLLAETRLYQLKLPRAIASEERFNRAIEQHIHTKSRVLSAEGIATIERLFLGAVSLAIETKDGIIVSGSSAHGALSNSSSLHVHAIKISFKDGHYSSKNAHIIDGPMTGLDGLRFWLNTIQAHLGEESRTTCFFFVVGTHLDKVSREASDSRRSRVESLFRTLQIQVPHAYHEISFYPFDGCAEVLPGMKKLHDAMIEVTLQLSHMGEIVPNAYLSIADAIAREAERRRAHGECMSA
jgi:hypothetical protein